MITIFYTGDNVMFTQIVISVVSLANTTKEKLRVLCLTTEIPEFDTRGKKLSDAQIKYCNDILKKANKDSEFISIDVSEAFKKHLLGGPNDHNKFYSYYVAVRLLADLVPEIGDKAIYLDTDTIMQGDIKELWDINVDDVELAGRKDKFRIKRYFQTGVMLLNMKRCRETGVFERTRHLCRTKKFFAYIDMTSLNMEVKKRKMLNKRFNDYSPHKNTIVFHACDVREGKIIFTKKWWHRIKSDEIEQFKKYCPSQATLMDDIAARIDKNPELFYKKREKKTI